MKTIMILLLSLISLNSYSQEIRRAVYLSKMNFGMGAITINPKSQDEVEVIIQQALLSYSDSVVNLELTEALSTAFKLPNLNSLIITYQKSECKVLNLNENQLISCVSSSNTGISNANGAEIDHRGNVLERSQIHLPGNFNAEVVLNAELSARNGQYQELGAKLYGKLEPNNQLQEKIYFNQTKSNLHPYR